jgi:hypothetical protein
MQNEGTLESIDSAEGQIALQSGLPGWYISYLAYLYEREMNLTEWMSNPVPGKA